MQAVQLFIGVDVSKADLAVAEHARPGVRVVLNEALAIKAWLDGLPSEAVLAMESTGVYHQLLAKLAYARGLRVYVLNARDVFFYAKALGARGKTDRVDAMVIARYVAEHQSELHPWRAASQAHTRIQELTERRAVLSTKLSSVRQAMRGCDELADQLGRLQQAFEDLLSAIDQQVHQLIEADACMAAARKRLAGITGIGPQGSAMLTALLARIPFANADALVAYSGLDPRANDSGTMRGKRRLSKRGHPSLRRQMYLAGFSASKSKALKPLYLALRAKGFSPTEAFVILGRKLLRAAFAVWKTGEDFDLSKMRPQV
jgi:transposase